MTDETVSQTKNVAGQLLSSNRDKIQPPRTSAQTTISEYQPDDEAEQEIATAPANSSTENNFHDDLLSAIERTIKNGNEDDFVDETSPSITPEVVAETYQGAPSSARPIPFRHHHRLGSVRELFIRFCHGT